MDKFSQLAESSPAFAQAKNLVGEITSSNVNMLAFLAFVAILVVQVRGFMVGVPLFPPSYAFVFMPLPSGLKTF